MGYNVYLCKTDEWSTSEEDPIDEKWFWDHIMKSKDYKVVKENDQPIAHCLTHRKLDSCPILRFSNGRIEVKNPNEQAIKKLCTLASKLKLNLVGDDGEKYKLGWFGRVQTIG